MAVPSRLSAPGGRGLCPTPGSPLRVSERAGPLTPHFLSLCPISLKPKSQSIWGSDHNSHSEASDVFQPTAQVRRLLVTKKQFILNPFLRQPLDRALSSFPANSPSSWARFGLWDPDFIPWLILAPLHVHAALQTPISVASNLP